MPRSRIPVDLTSFVGRAAELDQLAALVGTSRLVTLTGSAGSGKTRLALELARRIAAGSEGWAWTELAALREPGLIAPAIAEAVRLREEVRPGDVESLARLIGDQEARLVVDNCEHLVEAVAETVDALLQSCPALSIVATSREALGVRGERAWLVPPLALPGDDVGADPATAEAVRLFVDRARDVVPGFDLTPATAPAVAEICRRLDGIPLAIELAAARVRVLQPAEIVSRLDDVFRLLTDDRRTAVPRHRTLRAAIDWSHDLLQEPARVLLRRLAVFRGGFTLDAAERVGAGGAIEADQVLDLVARLVDRSMLGVRERHGFARYHLLEAVRQYAVDRLHAAGEDGDTRSRHAAYFLERVQEAEPHLTGPERRIWVERLGSDIDNLRSALSWSHDADRALHVRLVGASWWFWFSTRHWTEGGRWIDGALRLEEAAQPGPDRAALLFAAGALAALQVRSDDARPALEEAAALAAGVGDPRLEAYALNYLGMTYAGEGSARATELCERAGTWFRENGDLYGLRLALLLQGSTAMAQGRLEEAERLNREAVEVARRFGQDRELAISLQNLAVVYIVQGRLDDAEGLIREALRASLGDPSYYFVATGISYLGEIEGLRDRPLEAARLLGGAEALRDLVGARPFPVDARRVEGLLPRLREIAGAEAFEAAWVAGRAVSPDTLLEEEATLSGATPGPAVSGATQEPGGVRAMTPAARGTTTLQRGGSGPEVGGPPSLVVQALGRFRSTVEGVEVEEDRWHYAKPRELLVYLLVHRTGRSRDQIGEALWPGAARSNVKNSFHVTLHHLRKTLGRPEWIGIEGERYRLDPDLDVRFDADTFEARARQALAEADGDPGTIRDAMDLYRGELLEGEVVGRWVDEPRDRLRRLHLELGLALGATLESTDPAAAADLYRALAARDELDEEIHRRLMGTLAQGGDRVAALRHYRRLVDLLDDHLDAEPEPETRELYERLRAGQPVP